MKKRFSSAISLLVCIATPALAEYNDNISARITGVLTYDGGHFLLTMDRMPSGPCSNYFIIPNDVPVDGRQMLLSRSLLAKSTGEAVNIGFDNKTCVNGWYRVHRIG
jgi:hypothetical protein